MGEDKYEGCGISRIWATSEKDPFLDACIMHDGFYSKDSWASKNLSRAQADKTFLISMLVKANSAGSLKLKLRAYLFYGIVRVFGGFWWDGQK